MLALPNQLMLVLLLATTSAIAKSSADQTLRMSGHYEYRTDAQSREVLGDQVCFYPDATSGKTLPRSRSDMRLSWFCFSNTTKAKNALGIQRAASTKACGVKGRASVVIADYSTYKEEGDGNDVAKLLSATPSSKQSVLECRQ